MLLFYGQDNKRSSYAQCDHIFYGRGASPARQMQSWHERWWQFVCVWVGGCMHLPGEKREEIMKDKNIPIKIVHGTIKLLCAHRPCGSDCTSYSSPCLPLASSIASSLLWSLPFLSTSLTPSVATHTHEHCLCECVFSPPFFLSFPPWVSPRLWSASQTCTSLSPFLSLLCCSSVFLYHASYTFVPLGFLHCFLPYTYTSSHSQPRSCLLYPQNKDLKPI